MTDFKPPLITGTTDDEKIDELFNYLYQRAELLNYALSFRTRAESKQEAASKVVQTANKGNLVTEKDAEAVAGLAKSASDMVNDAVSAISSAKEQIKTSIFDVTELDQDLSALSARVDGIKMDGDILYTRDFSRDDGDAYHSPNVSYDFTGYCTLDKYNVIGIINVQMSNSVMDKDEYLGYSVINLKEFNRFDAKYYIYTMHTAPTNLNHIQIKGTVLYTLKK